MKKCEGCILEECVFEEDINHILEATAEVNKVVSELRAELSELFTQVTQKMLSLEARVAMLERRN